MLAHIQNQAAETGFSGLLSAPSCNPLLGEWGGVNKMGIE